MNTFLVTVSCVRARLIAEALLTAPSAADAQYEVEGPIEGAGGDQGTFDGPGCGPDGLLTEEAEKMLGLHGYVAVTVDASRYPNTLEVLGLSGVEPDLVH
jgi:hypothetical protein